MCGQSSTDYNVPVGAFAKELVSESFDLDSRLRQTLGPLLTRPGAVPRDYVTGHRARFMPPIRLYLLASFAMFLLMSLTGTFSLDPDAPEEAAELTVDLGPGGEEAANRIETRLTEGLAQAVQDREAFGQELVGHMAKAMFFLLPAFALLLKLLYWRRLYVHHLVFAIYLHSFAFLLMAVVMIPEALGFTRVATVADVGMLWAPVYLYLGMRRFYQDSRLKTFLKFVVLSLAYMILGVFALASVFVVSLLTP